MQPDLWRQANVTFADRSAAEHLAASSIGPVLQNAEDHGLLSAWFFIRKAQWRFRWLPTSPAAHETVLHTLAQAGESMTWTSTVCEFEPVAFGGEAGMDVACTLFHADSRHLLRRLEADQLLGRRETSILLCSTLLRGAGLDWFEQGDVWARVADLRPHETAIPADPNHARQLRDAMRTLMTTNTQALCDPVEEGPLSGCQAWITAFTEAGQALAYLNHHGELERGLRAVLAHHLIFHFNRAGLNGADQATMAALATQVVFHEGVAHDPIPPEHLAVVEEAAIPLHDPHPGTRPTPAKTIQCSTHTIGTALPPDRAWRALPVGGLWQGSDTPSPAGTPRRPPRVWSDLKHADRENGGRALSRPEATAD
ncbi:thiopeptide-type bacteriocin biosynthesis protein [Streptosporangium sp. KLBMP 9127]|nr:thiopeptide-type bacteriocin biosynthesis protein [Streptosporangium sp. KLBMP 9127]